MVCNTHNVAWFVRGCSTRISFDFGGHLFDGPNGARFGGHAGRPVHVGSTWIQQHICKSQLPPVLIPPGVHNLLTRAVAIHM